MDKKSKRIHYEMTKNYFRKSVAGKKGYYINKSLGEVKNDLKKRTMWKTYVSILDNLLMNDSESISVLDAGCGMGNFVLELTNYDQFNKIVGIDFLKETFYLAFENKKQFEKVTFIQGNLLNLPFQTKSFDVTFCLNVLHHIHKKDIDKTLRELARITNKYLIIEIRNTKNIFNILYEKLIIPLFFRDLPLYCYSIKEVNKSIKQQFKLDKIKGKFSKIWGCRRVVLIYNRIQ